MQQFEISNPTSIVKAGPGRTIQDFVRRWLTGRRGLIIGGIAIVVAGLVSGWDWLTVIGVGPIILSLALCAAMCAIGACAMTKGNSSGAKPSSADQATPSEPISKPTQPGGQEA